MDTASLKEFLALVETQNFWEASELLFMNESTLSKHIKKLEKELQVSLFDRIGIPSPLFCKKYARNVEIPSGICYNVCAVIYE